MVTPLLQTKNLSVAIGNRSLCNDLSFSVYSSQCWGILGLNGIGKTTLLYTLAGLKLPKHGNISLNGSLLSELSQQKIAQIRGILFQNTTDYFTSTVFETALSGRHPHIKGWQWENEIDREITSAALHEAGLSGMEQRLTNQLSAGERQRLAIATLLAQDPQLYLLDELTSHLDLHHQSSILDLLVARIKNTNKALMMVLHDINLAARYCDHLILIYGPGKILQGTTEEILTQENLEKLYQRNICHIKISDTEKIFYVT